MARITSYTAAEIDEKLSASFPASRISDFGSAVDNRVKRGQINGVASLDALGRVPSSQMPASYLTQAQAITGYAAIDDLFATVYRDAGIPNSGNTPIPIFVVPFACRINSVAITSFQTTMVVGRSDVNWWLARLRYTRPSESTSAINLATKTTRINPSGPDPDGEEIRMVEPWRFKNDFESSPVSLMKDDVVSIIFAPTGTPTAIPGPIAITVGYRPINS